MLKKCKYFIFSDLLIILLTVITSFIFTLLISNNILNPNTGKIVVKIISAIIFSIGGIYLGRKLKSKGYAIGICAILFYLFIILCLSITNLKFSTVDIIVRSICLFAGSIIGVNLAKN